MENNHSETLELIDRLKKVKPLNSVYLQVMEAEKISDIIKQVAPTNMISPQEAANIVEKEEEDYFIVSNINESLKAVRPLKQGRAFFI